MGGLLIFVYIGIGIGIGFIVVCILFHYFQDELVLEWCGDWKIGGLGD